MMTLAAVAQRLHTDHRLRALRRDPLADADVAGTEEVRRFCGK